MAKAPVAALAYDSAPYRNRPDKGLSKRQWERTRQRIIARDVECVLRMSDGRECSGRWEIDHIIPLADGGSNEDDNLQLLCHWHHVIVTKGAQGGTGSRMGQAHG